MKINKVVSYFFFLLASVSLLFACSTEETGTTEETELNIVASFFPVYEFTQKVAGDRADVSLMVSDGADPHSYEPSAQNIAAINEADVFVYSSEDMEFWTESLLNSVENENLIVARTADGLESESHYEEDASDSSTQEEGTDTVLADVPVDVEIIGAAGHYHTGDMVTLRAQYTDVEEWQWFIQYSGEEWELVEGATTDRFEYEATSGDFYVQAVASNSDGTESAQSNPSLIHIDDHEEDDPHIWLDPVLAQDQVNIIRDALIEADPEGEEYYSENAEDFNAELQTLHEAFEEAFEGAENRTFIVQHQAFGYIASRYHLEQIAIGGLSTEVEPSPSRIAEIGQLVDEYNVPVIYYQHGANSSIAQTVASETDTETAILHDLETLSEELQAQDLGFIDAMYENLESLKLSIN